MKKDLVKKFLASWLAMLATTIYADTTSVNYTAQIERAPLFPTSLAWVGKASPSAGESQVLYSDITVFQSGGISAGFDQLENFLEEYPNSAWAPSLHVNMAEYYRAQGSYSLALKHWQAVWDLTKNGKDATSKKMAARTLAGWTRLLGTLGEKEELHAIFAEMNALNLPLGTYGTTIQETEEGLNIMDTKPGVSYRCGSFALGNMAKALHLDQTALKLFLVDSPDGGFHISELLALAQTNGMAVVAVRCPPGADLVVPSVVHWKLNHYAAITEKKGDLYKVEDPTFAGHVWMTAATIEEESGGEFILPKGKVPAGWQPLSAAECADTYGKGYGNLIFDILDMGYFCQDGDIDLSGNDMPWGSCFDPGGLCAPCCTCGMPWWYVSEPYITLWLYDSPIPYYQSDGNAMELKLSYKSRGNAQNSYVAGFGDDWTCNWIGMLQYQSGQDTITDFRAGGGEEIFNTNGTPDYYTARMFEYVPIGTSNCPALVTQKGEEDIYGYAEPLMSGMTNYLLTETVDQFGRVLKQFNYQSVGAVVQLTSVIDMDGRTNTLAYGNTVFPYLITAVTNAYGRVAYFNYSTNELQLTITNTVDAQGMSTFFEYDQDENVTNLITPYGTNSFEYFSSINSTNQNAVTRTILITEPTSDHQLYAYEDYTHIDPSDTNGHDRASFHWNRAQYAAITDEGQTNFIDLSTNDFSYASFKQWLHGDPDTNNPEGPGWTLSDTLEDKADPYDSTLTKRPSWLLYTYEGGNHIVWGGVPIPYIGDTNGGFKQVTAIDSLYNTNGSDVGILRNTTNGLVNLYINDIYTNGYTFGEAFYINTYDASGRIVQNEIEFEPGIETIFGYGYTNDIYNPGVTNLLIAATNAVGDVTRYTHDPTTLKLTSTIFPSGLVETNIYYASGPNQGFLEEQADIGIRTNYFAYTNGNLSIETNALGLVTAYQYDNLNRLISTTYPDGTTESNIYDKLDIVATKDRLNQWTCYVYNSLRELVAETNVNGEVTTYDYCGCGALDQIDQIDGANQYFTFFSYNMGGLLTNVVYPDGYSLSYVHDLNDNVSSVADGNGNQWNNANIEEIGQQFTPISINLNGNQSSSLTLDQLGRVISRQNFRADGIVTNGYDFLNRVTSRQLYQGNDSPESGPELFGYTAAGMTNSIDALGHTNIFVRDTAGRVIYETNADLEITKYTYNAADEPLTLTDGNNHTTTWAYDQYGRMTNRTDAAGNSSVFQYDPLGRLTNRWTTAKGTTAYRYDPIGNLTNIDYSLATVSAPSIYYAYDGLNRMTNMVDASGASVFTWTSGNQLASETGPWPDDTISYAYNAARQRSGLALLEPNAHAWTQTYGYDSNLQLNQLDSPADDFTFANNGDLVTNLSSANYPQYHDLAFSYDGGGVLSQMKDPLSGSSAAYFYHYDRGLEVTQEIFVASNYVNYTYDKIGQLKTERGFESDGTNRWQEQYGYAYDNAGNLFQRTNNALIQTFITNNLNELASASRSGTYTVAGDTTEAGSLINSVTVNGSNALVYLDGTFAATNFSLANGNNPFTAIANDSYGRWSTNTVTAYLPATPSYTYDSNGNLTNDGTRNFVYDDENELVGVWVANTWSNSFVYDGKWRKRIEQDYTWNGSSWVESGEVHFIYDGNRVIQERDANNLPQVTYTWGTTGNRVLQGDRVGGLLARTENSQLAIGAPFATAYYINDRNGNVMYLMYSNNLPAAAYEYDPFGNTLAMSGPLAGANRYRYSGEEWNDTAGLYYYGRRFYDPSLQRWPNRDPIQELGGLNLYAYVGNNPINAIDRLGLSTYFDENYGDISSYQNPANLPVVGAYVGVGVAAGAAVTGVGLAVDAYGPAILAALGITLNAADTPEGQEDMDEAAQSLEGLAADTTPCEKAAQNATEAARAAMGKGPLANPGAPLTPQMLTGLQQNAAAAQNTLNLAQQGFNAAGNAISPEQAQVVIQAMQNRLNTIQQIIQSGVQAPKN